MLRIAFASDDRTHVNLHFGGADTLVLYDVAPGQADLVGVGRFIKAENAGTEVRAGKENTVEDKLTVKLDFLKGCAAVYAANIGASAIRRLIGSGIQPIIVDSGHDIVDLLNEVSFALAQGGLSWVDKAVAKARATGATPVIPPAYAIAGAERQRLITSLEEME